MARASTYMWPGFELTVDSDGEVVESNLLVADRDWKFVDGAGHGHLWQDGYPTLNRVEPGCDMGHGDDCPGEVYYVCPLCGEVVKPHLTNAPPTWVANPPRYTLKLVERRSTEVWRFGPDRYEALDDAVRAAIRDALGDPDKMEYRSS
jgi:hypothetical protein